MLFDSLLCLYTNMTRRTIYGYEDGNPMSRVDPLGLALKDWIKENVLQEILNDISESPAAEYGKMCKSIGSDSID